MMKKFCTKILFFIIPLVLSLIPPMFFIITTGENFKRIDSLILKEKPFLVGYAFNEQNYKYLKWKTIISHEKFDVMALGSSRVLSFRDQMFDGSFYNAGYMISSINDFIPFLKSIPTEKLPNYLLIGLDQWMFNEAWDNLKNVPSTNNWSNSFKLKPNANTIINVWKNLLANKYNYRLLKGDKSRVRIGINAVFNSSGFRNDGSFYYGGQIEKLICKDETANDYNYANTLDRISKGDRLFQHGNKVNKKALLELDRILQFCDSKQIKVAAFLPPFADKVNDKLNKSGNYKYMDSIYLKSINLFRNYNYELYDFSKLETINSNDHETIDGFHGGEVTYLNLLIKILESDSNLNNISNIEQLRLNLENRKNRFEAYE